MATTRTPRLEAAPRPGFDKELSVVQRQKERVDASVRLMNCGIEMLRVGRDSQAIKLLDNAFDTARYAMCVQEQQRLRQMVGRKASMLSSHTASSMQDGKKCPRAFHLQPSVDATPDGAFEEPPHNNRIEPLMKRQNMDVEMTPAVSENAQLSSLTAPSNSGANVTLFADNTAFYSQARPAETSEHVHPRSTSSSLNVGTPETVPVRFIFEGIHNVVPIRKRDEGRTPRRPDPSILLPDLSSSSSRTSYLAYSNAIMLSPEAINAARDQHRSSWARTGRSCFSAVDSCSHDSPAENRENEEDGSLSWNSPRTNGNCGWYQGDVPSQHVPTSCGCREADLAIDTAFLRLILPTVTACIAYNTALLYDFQSRSIADPGARTHFRNRACDLYASIRKLVTRPLWQTLGTACLLRIAATNNGTVLRMDRRVSSDANIDGWARRHAGSAFREMCGMLRYRERCFARTAVAVGDRDADGVACMKRNVSLWLVRVQLQSTRYHHAATA